MIGLAFKILSTFWMMSPVGFCVGRYFGVWKTSHDWLIFLGLTIASTFVCFLNYTGDDETK